MSAPIMLPDLIAHAERFGVEFVYEMGADLTAVDRAVLADRLHSLDPRWQPPRALGLPLAAKAMPEKGSDQGARVSVTCGACGAPFTAHRSTARYCSATCRKRANRRAKC